MSAAIPPEERPHAAFMEAFGGTAHPAVEIRRAWPGRGPHSPAPFELGPTTAREQHDGQRLLTSHTAVSNRPAISIRIESGIPRARASRRPHYRSLRSFRHMACNLPDVGHKYLVTRSHAVVRLIQIECVLILDGDPEPAAMPASKCLARASWSGRKRPSSITLAFRIEDYSNGSIGPQYRSLWCSFLRLSASFSLMSVVESS